MRELSAEGIILKKNKFAESDLILRVLTSEGRKLSLIAKGALQSKKRFSGGVLEPTHFISFKYQPAKESLHLLTSAELVQSFPGLREDYDKISSALELLGLVDRVVLEGQNQETLFGLTGNALTEISRAQELTQFWIHFGVKFLYQQGVLELEDWMKIYLSCKIGELHEKRLPPDGERASFIKQRLKSYVESAQV